jgi:hypothetical protein
MRLPDSIKQELLRERDVQREYGFTGPYLRKRRRLGLDPVHIKINRSVWYERTAIDQFIARHRVNPAGGAL